MPSTTSSKSACTDSGSRFGVNSTAPDRENSSTFSTSEMSRFASRTIDVVEPLALARVALAVHRERLTGEQDLRERHSQVVRHAGDEVRSRARERELAARQRRPRP